MKKIERLYHIAFTRCGKCSLLMPTGRKLRVAIPHIAIYVFGEGKEYTCVNDLIDIIEYHCPQNRNLTMVNKDFGENCKRFKLINAPMDVCTAETL